MQVRQCRLRTRPGRTVLEAKSKGTRRGEAGGPAGEPSVPPTPAFSAPGLRVVRGLNSGLQARTGALWPGPGVRPGPPSHLPLGAGGVLPLRFSGEARPDGPRVLRAGALQASAASRVPRPPLRTEAGRRRSLACEVRARGERKRGQRLSVSLLFQPTNNCTVLSYSRLV